MIVVQHIDLDGEIVVGQGGDIEGGGVGGGSIVPQNDASVAGARAEACHRQDVGVTDVGTLQAQKGRSKTVLTVCFCARLSYSVTMPELCRHSVQT